MAGVHTVTFDAGLPFALNNCAFLDAVCAVSILTTAIDVRRSGFSEALRAEWAGEGFEKHAYFQRPAAVRAFAFLLITPDGDYFGGFENYGLHVESPGVAKIGTLKSAVPQVGTTGLFWGSRSILRG